MARYGKPMNSLSGRKMLMSKRKMVKMKEKMMSAKSRRKKDNNGEH